MENLPVLSLHGDFHTDYSGIKRLFEFYHKASEHSNTTVYLDFYHLTWIDANLCALLQSMLFKLNSENNLTFSADLNYISEKFNVLFKNGFVNNGSPVLETNNSAIVLKSFSSKDKSAFVKYINDDMLNHNGMPPLKEDTRDTILTSLIELFNNIDIHAESKYPLFVCGQYYPKQAKVVFSIVDLGIGFLPPISKKTNGEIDNCLASIKWALIKRNTTKKDTPGGLGLTDLHRYCKSSNGVIQIITGDTYWSSDLEKTVFSCHKFKLPYTGSIINLHFSCN